MIIFVKSVFAMTDQIGNLYFKSKKISLMILVVTALTCVRTMFFFFDDVEGPNLFIVTVLGLIVFFLSWAAYWFSPFKINGIKRLISAVCFQILLVIGFYFVMK